jgi:hypothetical protein
MKKATAIILIGTGLVIGMAAGAVGIAMVTNKAARQVIHYTFESDIDSLLSKADAETEALTYLRAGQTTNAVKSLDDNLETDLIKLAPYATVSNEFKSNPWRGEILRKTMEYRAQFPYKTNPYVETNVNILLDLSDAMTNR